MCTLIKTWFMAELAKFHISSLNFSVNGAETIGYPYGKSGIRLPPDFCDFLTEINLQ